MRGTGDDHSFGWLPTLGWAAYLACSWTWCIGMFLPVLLVRDYGPWGFVVFAVPNVIGAAAMGWVLSNASTAAVVGMHRPATRAFSLVTILFQSFFAFIVIHGSTKGAGASSASVLIPVASILGVWLGRGSTYRAIAAWVLSTAALAYILFIAPAAVPATAAPTASEPESIAFLAPVCIFGFALCPYLDRTFHAAFRGLPPRERRWAFSLGFGVLFTAMIVGTYLYAPIAARVVLALRTDSLAAALLVSHILMQLGFTVSAHYQSILHELTHARLVPWGVFIGALAISFAVVLSPHVHPDMVNQELVYRLFISCYGLLFPAYVWLCVIPTGTGPRRHSGIHGSLGRFKLAVCIIAVAVAAPCYWMGFIEREEVWLAPGLLIVLVSRLLVLRPSPRTSQDMAQARR